MTRDALDLVATLADAVRTIRERQQLSQAQLGAELGHGQTWCCRVERGDRQATVADVEQLSSRFGLSLEDGRWILPETRDYAARALNSHSESAC